MRMNPADTIGKGIAFPPHVGGDGRVAWSTGSDNVTQAIQVTLLTQVGERLMLAGFGTRLRTYVFQPNTPATRRLIQEEVTKALQRWEPRIEVQSVVVEVDPADSRSAVATVYYRLVATQGAGQVALKVNLAQ
jgi:phage baseplate assembly protein W